MTRYFKATLPDGRVTARTSARAYVCCIGVGQWSSKPKRGAAPAVEIDAREYRAILKAQAKGEPIRAPQDPLDVLDDPASMEGAPTPRERPKTLRQHIQSAIAEENEVQQLVTTLQLARDQLAEMGVRDVKIDATLARYEGGARD
jgi:hypothetical protein